jgi:hypothetical protein
MASFDFISDKDFRQSLESDYKEMRANIEGGAWKSAQVIAGSVVEALLVEHLISFPVTGGTGKEPLKLDLAEAIAVCRDAKVLTPRTADLCSVVRSYRNLIHPGRLVRLDEPRPSKESASIALSLVELITEELARVRQKQVGLTAEQLLAKVTNDADVMAIFKHLVLEASEQQRQRLVLEILPGAYSKLDYDSEDWVTCLRLESAYHVTLETLSDESKKKVALEFVRVLRDADGEYLRRFADAFFRAPYLEHVPEGQQRLVVGYLLGRLESVTDARTLSVADGMCPYMTPEEAPKWVDALVKAAVSAGLHEVAKKKAADQLSNYYMGTKGPFDAAVRKRFAEWQEHFRRQGATDKAATLDEIEENMLPF